METYVIALDQGTTSSRAILFDRAGNIVSRAQHPFHQIYPQPGWVEHDPLEIWATEKRALAEAVDTAHIDPKKIAAIGITNQRETTILWDARTGEPVHNAIVWQCRRTAALCDRLKAEGLGQAVTEKTGLLIDAYFSGTKIRWLLDNIPGVRRRAESGELRAGTVDSWLIWNLTGGKVHVTDYSNASRTMLFNIHTLRWDRELCDALDIPMSLLPTPCPNSQVYGTVAPGIPGLEAPGQALWYLVFPALAIALPRAAMTVRMLRSTVVAEMNKAYVRTAISRGNDRGAVLRCRVLKNALVPVVTFLAQTMAEIVAGSIVVEQVFGIPGLGRMLVTSISNRDYPTVQAIVVILAFWVVLAGTVADLLNQRIDPRLRLGGAA